MRDAVVPEAAVGQPLLVQDAPPGVGTCGCEMSGFNAATRPRVGRRTKSALPLATVGRGMVARRVAVASPDVVFVKGLLEASDGLAALFSERGGDLVLVAPHGREAELGEFLGDLVVELGATIGAAFQTDCGCSLRHPTTEEYPS